MNRGNLIYFLINQSKHIFYSKSHIELMICILLDLSTTPHAYINSNPEISLQSALQYPLAKEPLLACHPFVSPSLLTEALSFKKFGEHS